MSSSEVLPRGRLLTTPKLHRRQHHVTQQNPPPPPVKMSPSPYHEPKIKCPPIDDVIELSCKSQSKTKTREMTSDCAISPLSPASGASAACVAMANACSHDHDYVAVTECASYENDVTSQVAPPQIISHRRREARSNSPLKSGHVDSDDVIESPRSLQRPQVPAPPMQPNSPREGKPTRATGGKLRRRFIKAENPSVSSDVIKPTSRRLEANGEKSKYVFVSTGPTAEYKAPRARTQRKMTPDKYSTGLTEQNTCVVATAKVNTKSTTRVASPAPTTIAVQQITSEDKPTSENFDVTKDELTVAWQSMVKDQRKKKGIKDPESSDEDHLPRHSTPVNPNTDLPLNFDLSLNSPQPSITPCPTEDLQLNLDESGCHDSAYSSLASSLMSPPPTSSGAPTFRADSRPGSRTRPPSGNRPPSGGKRVAPCSLSSSSSASSSTCATSSDEDESECDSMMSPPAVEDLPHDDVDGGKSGRNAPGSGKRSDSSRASSGKSVHSHRGHRLVTTKKGKKCLRQRDATGPKKAPCKTPVAPAPPRKPHPKRDPLPMRLRALPLSFWQEPNKLNPSPYSVLPPVPPLFRQGTSGDIADIRPVTPPDDEPPSPQVISQEEAQSVIHTNDPDLLLRLFEPVELQNRNTGIRVRRGRPKRTARVMPSPRLKLDDNPCIIESVTEKLFPKLQIDRRNFGRSVHSRAPSCASHAAIDAVTSSKMSLAPELVSFNSNTNNNSLGDSSAKDLGLLTLAGNSRASIFDDDVTVGADMPMEVGTPGHVVARQEMIALPPVTQDYSQMLTKVAAAL